MSAREAPGAVPSRHFKPCGRAATAVVREGLFFVTSALLRRAQARGAVDGAAYFYQFYG